MAAFRMKSPIYALKEIATRLGVANPLVRLMIRRSCARHGVDVSLAADRLDLCKGSSVIRLSRAHFVFAPAISANFQMHFDQVVAESNGNVFIVDYSKPHAHIYKGSGLRFELSSVPEEGEAIDGYLRWYTPKPGDLVFDVGANCGVSTYAFSKLVGDSGRVIAFEPDPQNYSLLLRNIAHHQLKNVTPIKLAIAASRGTAPFHSEGTIGSGLARSSSRPSAGTVEMVKTITLADSFAEYGEPAFCKVDIEGAEIEVIESSVELLAGCRTHFAFDTGHMVDGSLTNMRIERCFRRQGHNAASESVPGMMTTWTRPR